MKVDLELIFKIGSLAGLASLIYLLIKDLAKYFRQSRLKITFSRDLDLRTFTFPDRNWVRKFATLHIRNTRRMTATRCVAVLRILRKPENALNLEPEYSIHWAGVGYTLQTTGAEPVDIGSEPRRLDVVFTQEGQNLMGCWIAMPIALSGMLVMNQAYLPPGEYNIEIQVRCKNGKGDKAKFKITSPEIWAMLDMHQDP
jgi:hypothetical protein